MSPYQPFEDLIWPHLDAGYNLARWLVRDASVAEDMVQEAAMRAWMHVDSLRTEQARAWWLQIVRRTCFTHLASRRDLSLDALELSEEGVADEPTCGLAEPSRQLEHAQIQARVDAALRALAPLLREVVVLRELQELEYAEIAAVVGVPIGTVMSRLARARARLRLALADLGRADPLALPLQDG